MDARHYSLQESLQDRPLLYLAACPQPTLTGTGAMTMVLTGEGGSLQQAVTWRMATIGYLCVAAVAAPALACINAVAQQGPPNALQGLSANRAKPVNIKAVSLEVRDKDKIATFTGNVRVVQGDTNMRCSTLVVHYEN